MLTKVYTFAVALALFVAPAAHANSIWAVLSTNLDKSDQGQITLEEGMSATIEIYYDDINPVIGFDVNGGTTGSMTMSNIGGGYSGDFTCDGNPGVCPAGSTTYTFYNNNSVLAGVAPAFLMVEMDVLGGTSGDVLSIWSSSDAIIMDGGASVDPADWFSTVAPTDLVLTVPAVVIPEPGTALLLGGGLLVLAARRRH